jgi:Holliday junction resolvase RusA-like endonuclease
MRITNVVVQGDLGCRIDLKHSQHQIESILDIKIESNIQFFLLRNKAKEQIQQNETDIDNML